MRNLFAVAALALFAIGLSACSALDAIGPANNCHVETDTLRSDTFLGKDSSTVYSAVVVREVTRCK